MGNRWDGWTEETIERCKEMWFEHIPASKIGEEIGATRNMVIAKMNRLGFRKSNVLAIQAGEDIPNLMPMGKDNGHPVEEAVKIEETAVEAVTVEEFLSDPSTAVEPLTEEPVATEATATEVTEPEIASELANDEPVEAITATDGADDQHVMDEALADVTASIAEAFSPPEETVAEASDESISPTETEEAPVVAEPPAPKAPTSITCEGVSFFDIREGQCKFPLWDFNNTTPIHEKRFCGCTRVGTTSWCAKHLRVVADPIRRGPRPMRAR